MFCWEETEKEFYKMNCDKMDEHEDQLESIDYLNQRGLFVTGGKDGLVKVWNIKKELIREIKFPDPITSVVFLNHDGDILVGHIGKVSQVLAADYKPFEVPHFAEPTEEELSKYMKDKTIVTEHIFQTLKRLDDDIRKQVSEIIKKNNSPSKENLFHKDALEI